MRREHSELRAGKMRNRRAAVGSRIDTAQTRRRKQEKITYRKLQL